MGNSPPLPPCDDGKTSDVIYEYHPGFHLGFSARSRGGGKHDNCRAKRGSKDYSDTSNAFSLARNTIELIDFLKLGWSGGMLPQENFSIFETVSGGF